MNAAQIIDAAINQIGTDATRATVLGLLNEAYDIQVSEARWFRTEASIGNTVAGTAEYVIPDEIVEAYGLRVGSYPYNAIGEDIMWRITAGTVSARVGSAGVYSQGVNSAGAPTISLYPVPTVSGTAITVYAARLPTALTDGSGSSPGTPRDTHSSLVAGTAALVLLRIDERPDLAAPFQATYEAATERLRRRKNGLLRGGSPGFLQVQGVHF